MLSSDVVTDAFLDCHARLFGDPSGSLCGGGAFEGGPTSNPSVAGPSVPSGNVASSSKSNDRVVLLPKKTKTEDTYGSGNEGVEQTSAEDKKLYQVHVAR